jgi:hypothetical protein
MTVAVPAWAAPMVNEYDCGGAGVGGADAEVVHAAGSAEGDLAVAVDGVDPNRVGGLAVCFGRWVGWL